MGARVGGLAGGVGVCEGLARAGAAQALVVAIQSATKGGALFGLLI